MRAGSPDSPLGTAIADFCGQAFCVATQTQLVLFSCWQTLAIFEHKSLGKIDGCYKGFLMMPSAKTIATLASVAAIGCSLFAFSWVGLALLGF
jgi:hypothetical protein